MSRIIVGHANEYRPGDRVIGAIDGAQRPGLVELVSARDQDERPTSYEVRFLDHDGNDEIKIVTNEVLIWVSDAGLNKTEFLKLNPKALARRYGKVASGSA